MYALQAGPVDDELPYDARTRSCLEHNKRVTKGKTTHLTTNGAHGRLGRPPATQRRDIQNIKDICEVAFSVRSTLSYRLHPTCDDTNLDFIVDRKGMVYPEVQKDKSSSCPKNKFTLDLGALIQKYQVPSRSPSPPPPNSPAGTT